MITPRTIGPYRILEPLAQGGMGMLYVALQEGLDRKVALKVLPAQGMSTDDERRRFATEMTLLARLAHPRIVRILDGGDAGGVPFVAMELVDGKPLTGLCERGALAWPAALAIVSALADGLAYLHGQGIVHRDVSPANVMVASDGSVKLLDFGLARWAESTVHTAHGAVSGTLPFLAPELLSGASATAAADVWALGCIAYRLLTGVGHLTGTTVESWMCAILVNPITPPRRHAPALPVEIEALVMAMLERDPARRPAAARARDLADAIAARGSSLMAPAPSPAPSRTMPRARVAAGAIAFLAGGLAFLAVATRAPRPRPALASPSPTPAALAPARAPGADDPTALSAAWHRYTGYLARLRAGGPTARRAVAELRQRAPFDLGESTATWLVWFSLGAWLEDGADGAYAPEGGETDIFELGELLPRNRLKRVAARYGPQLCATAIAAIALNPRDPEHWLVLGRLLLCEARPHAASRAYRRALDLLGDRGQLAGAPPFVWCALAEALETSGHPDPVARFWRAAGSEAGSSEVMGLAMATARDPARRSRALVVTRRVTPAALSAMLATSIGQVLHREEPSRARALWREQLALTPGAPTLLEVLAQYELARGRIPASGPEAARVRTEPFYERLVPYLAGDLGSPEPLPPPPLPAWLGDDIGALDTLRTVEQGHVEPLAREIEARPERIVAANGAPLRALYDVIAADARATGAMGMGRAALLHDGSWRLRNAAAGAAMSPEGLAFLEAALPAVMARRPRDPLPHVTRALARARRGEAAAALAALEEARARTTGYLGEPIEDVALWSTTPPGERRRDPGRLPQAAVGEVLLRAAWSGQTRERVPALAAALLAPGPIAELALAAHAGDHARVLAIAEARFEDQPHEPLWAFAIAHETARTPSSARWQQRLAMAHRFAGTGVWMLRALARIALR